MAEDDSAAMVITADAPKSAIVIKAATNRKFAARRRTEERPVAAIAFRVSQAGKNMAGDSEEERKSAERFD
ncbi:MAG: hypothetical protein QM775_08240 [Pirellulales bacterium]